MIKTLLKALRKIGKIAFQDTGLKKLRGQGSGRQGVCHLDCITLGGKKGIQKREQLSRILMDCHGWPAQRQVFLKLFSEGSNQLLIRGKHRGITGTAGTDRSGILGTASRYDDHGVTIQISAKTRVIVGLDLTGGIKRQPELKGFCITVDVS